MGTYIYQIVDEVIEFVRSKRKHQVVPSLPPLLPPHTHTSLLSPSPPPPSHTHFTSHPLPSSHTFHFSTLPLLPSSHTHRTTPGCVPRLYKMIYPARRNTGLEYACRAVAETDRGSHTAARSAAQKKPTVLPTTAAGCSRPRPSPPHSAVRGRAGANAGNCGLRRHRPGAQPRQSQPPRFAPPPPSAHPARPYSYSYRLAIGRWLVKAGLQRPTACDENDGEHPNRFPLAHGDPPDKLGCAASLSPPLAA